MFIQTLQHPEGREEFQAINGLNILLLRNYIEYNDPHICYALKEDLEKFIHFHIYRLENLSYWVNAYDDKSILESYDLYLLSLLHR